MAESVYAKYRCIVLAVVILALSPFGCKKAEPVKSVLFIGSITGGFAQNIREGLIIYTSDMEGHPFMTAYMKEASTPRNAKNVKRYLLPNANADQIVQVLKENGLFRLKGYKNDDHTADLDSAWIGFSVGNSAKEVSIRIDDYPFSSRSRAEIAKFKAIVSAVGAEAIKVDTENKFKFGNKGTSVVTGLNSEPQTTYCNLQFPTDAVKSVGYKRQDFEIALKDGLGMNPSLYLWLNPSGIRKSTNSSQDEIFTVNVMPVPIDIIYCRDEFPAIYCVMGETIIGRFERSIPKGFLIDLPFDGKPHQLEERIDADIVMWKGVPCPGLKFEDIILYPERTYDYIKLLRVNDKNVVYIENDLFDTMLKVLCINKSSLYLRPTLSFRIKAKTGEADDKPA
jgi:hypothetical protein